MTWGGIAAALFLVLYCIRGFRRGFVNEALSMVFTVLAISLAWSINPYVMSYLGIASAYSFVISYFVVGLGIRVLAHGLNLAAGLPVLRQANHLTGALVGAARGFMILSMLFLILKVFRNTTVGSQWVSLVNGDPFLSFLYKYNVFLNIFSGIF